MISQPPMIVRSLFRLRRLRAMRRATSALLVTAIGVSVALIVYYSFPRDRSVFVEVRTEIAEVQLSEVARLVLARATVCFGAPRTRVSKEPVNALMQANGAFGEASACAPGEVTKSGLVQLNWPVGTELRIRRRGRGTLEMEPISDVESDLATMRVSGEIIPLKGRPRVLIGSEDFAANGAFLVEGKVTIGKRVAAGTSATTIDGTYEFRETLAARERPVLIGPGSIMLGDVIRIIDQENGAVVSSNFVSAADADDNGFRIVASAGASGSVAQLQLTRHGYAPTSVEPNWYDHALSDQLVYAIVTVFGVCLALLNFGTAIRDLTVKDNLVEATEPSLHSTQKVSGSEDTSSFDGTYAQNAEHIPSITLPPKKSDT